VPCDPDSLRSVVAAQLGRGKLVVVSNREPYVHSRRGQATRVTAPAGGLVTGRSTSRPTSARLTG
jgi:trehalose 6-phosphate synthase